MSNNKKRNKERWNTLAILLYNISLDIEMMGTFKKKYGDEMSDLEQGLFNQLEGYVAQASSFANGMLAAMGVQKNDQ